MSRLTTLTWKIKILQSYLIECVQILDKIRYFIVWNHRIYINIFTLTQNTHKHALGTFMQQPRSYIDSTMYFKENNLQNSTSKSEFSFLHSVNCSQFVGFVVTNWIFWCKLQQRRPEGGRQETTNQVDSDSCGHCVRDPRHSSNHYSSRVHHGATATAWVHPPPPRRSRVEIQKDETILFVTKVKNKKPRGLALCLTRWKTLTT